MLSKANSRFDSNLKAGHRHRGGNESLDYSDDTIPYSSIPVDKGGMTRVSLLSYQINC